VADAAGLREQRLALWARAVALHREMDETACLVRYHELREEGHLLHREIDGLREREERLRAGYAAPGQLALWEDEDDE
jgi:hypothetical protein